MSAKISALADGAPAQGDDDFPIARAGANARLAIADVLAAVYPVGALYVSTAATSPATLFGFGTWAAFAAGRVLVGLDATDPDFDVAEETGGAKTVAAVGTNSVPIFTGSALGTHAHDYSDIVQHTHAVNVTDGGHNHTQNSHNHTQDAHNHTQDAHNHAMTNLRGATTGGTTTGFGGIVAGNDTSSTVTAWSMPTAVATNIANTTGITATTDNPVGSGASGTTDAVSAGTPAGTVSAPVFTGSATSVVQPYIVVYMWERTA